MLLGRAQASMSTSQFFPRKPEKKIFNTVNSGMYGLGVKKKKKNSQRPVTYNSNCVSGLFFFFCTVA